MKTKTKVRAGGMQYNQNGLPVKKRVKASKPSPQRCQSPCSVPSE